MSGQNDAMNRAMTDGAASAGGTAGAEGAAPAGAKHGKADRPPPSTLRLSGVIPPIVTPFRPDRTVDEEALEGLAEHMIRSGVSGIFALGTAGEAPMLTKKQRGQALAVLGRVCRGRVPLLVGVLESGTDRALECAEEAHDYEASGLVAMAPYYYKVKQEEIVRHFAAIREATPLPLIVYNIPAYLGTGNTIEPETIAEIARMPKVAGYKDSSGNMAQFQKTLRLTRELPHFSVLQGVQALSAVSLQMGAHGLVPGIGNVIPERMVALFRAAADGCWEEAYALQHAANRLDESLAMGGYSLATLKAMVRLIGFGGGVPHYPWPPLTGTHLQRLRAILAEQRIALPAEN